MPNIIPVFISYAGCPHQCAFCNQHAINSQQEFSLAAVWAQIDKYLAYYPVASEKELAFYGGSFTGLPEAWQEALLGLTQNLAASHKVTKIRVSTRPDYIDEQVVQRLKRYKVQLVELGVQSLDDRVLAAANRGHDSAAVVKAASLLKTAGLAFGLQLMAGLPRQGWSSIRQTVEQVLALQPSVVRIYPLVIFAGTDFARLHQAGQLQLPEFTEVVQQVAYMVEACKRNKIKVIRVGLQEDDGLHTQGAILAGFHHPAFGELVASYNYRKQIENLLANNKNAQADILVPRRELSQALGHKKMNVDYFRQNYPGLHISFIPADVHSLVLASEATDE